MRLLLRDGDGDLALRAVPEDPEARAFEVHDEVAYSYERAERDPDAARLAVLTEIIAQIHPVIRAAIAGVGDVDEQRRGLPIV